MIDFQHVGEIKLITTNKNNTGPNNKIVKGKRSTLTTDWNHCVILKIKETMFSKLMLDTIMST